MQLVTKIDQHYIILCLSASNIQARRYHVLLFSTFCEFVSDGEVEPS